MWRVRGVSQYVPKIGGQHVAGVNTGQYTNQGDSDLMVDKNLSGSLASFKAIRAVELP